MRPPRHPVLTTVTVAALTLTGCGLLPSSDPPDPTGPPASTSAPDDGAVSTLDGVRSAVVQIVARGTFVDPDLGVQYDSAGAGSGFVIDPSGIAVTNNHVVTGAATIEVFVDGEDRPRNARVLASSECSDLAVIDIDGEELPYLDLYQEQPTTGLEVYSAGFPLGDPEFTLTRGIVSKERADGESPWASVDGVIEHDAVINPGNSGGPLVTADGAVVGVNYAGSSDTDQYFAIASPTFQDVIEELRRGTAVDWLGINGQALADDETGLYGVWVAAVESGSPASSLGLQAGDLITTMENLTLATDGTMADYCDVLRTQGADAEISAQVVRPETGEVLQGAFNSGEELVVTSLPEVEDDGPAAEGTAYTDYDRITDATGSLAVEVPVEWDDVVDTSDDGQPALQASSDGSGFAGGFTTPGVVMFLLEADEAQDPEATLAAYVEGVGADAACPEPAAVSDYEDSLYTGVWQLLGSCEGTDATFVAIVATSADRESGVFVGVQVVSEADTTALEKIIGTFVVTL